MLIYVFLHVDRDHEVNFLRENADVLKSQHASLNEEANNLNTQMTVGLQNFCTFVLFIFLLFVCLTNKQFALVTESCTNQETSP